MKTLAHLAGCLLHVGARAPKQAGYRNLLSFIPCPSGDLFVCLPGTRSGRQYVAEAVAAGASTVVTDIPGLDAGKATVLQVPDTRLALALLSACYYDYPSRELVLVGVTGTNGKTTTTHLIDALLQAKGAATGLIGTVAYRVRGRSYPSAATTRGQRPAVFTAENG